MRIRTSRVPKDLQKITKAGVKFFCDNFLHPRTKERMQEIHVKFEKFKNDDLAYCTPLDPTETRPTEFVIAFNTTFIDIMPRDYMLTLFHELTHMRQFATGQLRFLIDGTATWRRKNYPEDMMYWIQPWEIEAQGMEVSVYQMFVATNKDFPLVQFKPRYTGRAESGWLS